MEIRTETKNGAVTFALSGRLDSANAPELERAVAEQAAGASSLVFDLTGLSYTSSAGLRVFLSAQKRMRGRGPMKLVNVCPAVMEILEMTGFTEIMTVEGGA